MAKATLKDLLEAGVHFGHQSRYWNPKMAPYIYGVRNKLHIINLDKTLPLLHDAMNFVSKLGARKGKVLFVGTKQSAREVIAVMAKANEMPYVNHRWLGGLLTNYKTVRLSVKRLKDLEVQRDNGLFEKLSKKEALTKTRRLGKLEHSLGGIKNMGGLPDALFVIDVGEENIAVAEANRLGIPVIGIVDTNNDFKGVDYIIPGNDDSFKSIKLYLTNILDAYQEGRASVATGAKSEAEVAIKRKATKKIEPTKVEVSEKHEKE